jgi:hypothetical protein
MMLASAVNAATLTSSGGYTDTIDASDLVAGAGSALNSTYSSASNATRLDVTGTGGGAYTVTVRMAPGTWDGSFSLSVRRTTNGTGTGTITGGTTYIQLTTVDQVLFTGTGNRSNVRVQYQLTGMSVAVPPATYSSSVIFTITP